MLYPIPSLSLALVSTCAIIPSTMAALASSSPFSPRAPSHSYSVTNDNPAVKTTGVWGAFNTFAPLQGCPSAGMISASYNSGNDEPAVQYNFTGSAISATLVSDQSDCTAVVTVDGKDYELPVAAKAQGADCRTVQAPASGDLKEGKHTAAIKLKAREDGSRCQFVFVQFDVTTTSDSFAPNPPNPSTSSTAAGGSPTGSTGAAPTGSQSPGDGASSARVAGAGLVSVAALTLGWLVLS